MTLRLCMRLFCASLFSVAILAATFKDIDTGALYRAIRGLQVIPVLGYLLGLSLTQLARAVRWGMLTAPFAPMGPRRVWQVSNFGNMLIMLLPLRLGEFARPLMMRRLCGASLAAGMGAAFVERVLDGLLVTLLFIVVTSVQADAVVSAPLAAGARVALGIFVVAVLVLCSTMVAGAQLFALIRATVGRFWPALAARSISLLESFLLGLRALPDGRTFCGVVGWTLAYWAANAMGLWALMVAFDLPLLPIAAFTVVCVLVIGVMIPAGPGLLGTYQAAIMAGLSIYHVDKNVGAAFAVVAYLGNLSVIVAFGLPYVWDARNLLSRATQPSSAPA